MHEIPLLGRSGLKSNLIYEKKENKMNAKKYLRGTGRKENEGKEKGKDRKINEIIRTL